ncbi:hypothetical protein ASE26_07235 [Duganella sp. Root198D2]|nr:hypothetical protein ASD07_23035 [Duganella sp. Root336D2]KRB87182.1 hypothetical protein ASE26_07235 [Duganella sp. Root198D2]
MIAPFVVFQMYVFGQNTAATGAAHMIQVKSCLMTAATAAASLAALLRRHRWVAVFFQQFAQLVDAGQGVIEGDFNVRSTGWGVYAADAGRGAQQVKYAGHVGGVQDGSKLERMMHL